MKQQSLHPVDKLAAVAASVALAVTFLAVGLAVCAGPNLATRALAEAFSGADNPDTPFTGEELADMAVATKEYCFNHHDEAALYTVMGRINQQALLDGRLDPAAPGAPNLAAVPQADELFDIPSLMRAMDGADERYAYSQDAVSHLDDVYYLVEAVRLPFVLVGLFALAAAAHVGVRAGKRSLGSVLMAAGIVLLAALALVGAWAALDFNGFFAVFHSLFFAQGTWTFSWDSLLITALPLPFWMGMAGIWLGTAALLAAASTATGAFLRRRATRAAS